MYFLTHFLSIIKIFALRLSSLMHFFFCQCLTKVQFVSTYICFQHIFGNNNWIRLDLIRLNCDPSIDLIMQNRNWIKMNCSYSLFQLLVYAQKYQKNKCNAWSNSKHHTVPCFLNLYHGQILFWSTRWIPWSINMEISQ